jgi:DNA-binding MarR family transcriptional regulator
MTEERFSFRWGISLLDEGDTRIPNFFFDHYIDAGVERREFLLILHLARYQFEKADSECRPSIATVAEQMDYSTRTVQRILAGLEEKGLLKRRYRPGKTTLYDFTGFSRKILATELSTGVTPTSPPEVIHRGDVGVRGRGDAHVTPGVTPTSPEEQHEEEQTRTDDGDTNKNITIKTTTLTTFGVAKTVAARLAQQRTLEEIQGWIKYAKQSDGLHNPVAFVVARLRDGEPVPEIRGNGDERRRDIDGRYGDYINH